jgi:creatinine amidohydrolase
MRSIAAGMLLVLLVASNGLAQVPDSVFLEEFTWEEVRDLVADGKTTMIIATGGTEQNGPHMVLGKHNFVLEHTTDKIARELGNALVAPIIAYVPEGGWEEPLSGHMSKAGTISVPNDVFMEMLEHAVRSFRPGGFTDIVLLGDSGGNQSGMQAVAEKVNTDWKGSGYRAHFIGDYYRKSHDDQEKFLMENYGETSESIGSHAGILDTSEVLAINPDLIRKDKIALNGGYEDSGVRGDPTRASVSRGELMLAIKINNAIEQIRESIAAAQ